MYSSNKIISIIIPVYNTEKYLSACLESVLKQSFPDFEVICINDCSSDNSLDILNTYATEDQRITVINMQERCGLAAVRNAGLKIAKGKYIYFVDSDDIISPDLLEECLKLAEKENLDQIIFEAEVINELNTPSFFEYHFSEDVCGKIFRGHDLLSIWAPEKQLCMPVYLRFTRKKLLTDKQIFFPEGLIHEDNYFTIRCLLDAERVYVLKKSYYFRRLRENSIMTDQSEEADYQHVKSYFEIALKLISEASRYLSSEGKKRALLDSLGQVIYCFERDIEKLSLSSLQHLLEEFSQNIGSELSHAVLHFFGNEEEKGKFIFIIKCLATHSISRKPRLTAQDISREQSLPVQEVASEPLITVILPTYNRREVLPSAISCIVKQTLKAWRLLVINDGGEDLKDVVEKFNDPRIEYIDLPHQGKPAATNYGLMLVKSKYIAYMDDDDEVFPNHLELLYNAAEENNSHFVYSDTYLSLLDDSGNLIRKLVENDTDVTYEDIRMFNRINHKQILHTKELADKVGPYDTRMSILIDYDYIKRLAKFETPYHVRKITGNHYLRGNGQDQITGLWTKSPTKAGNSILALFEKDPESLSHLYSGYGQLKEQNNLLHSTVESKTADLVNLQATFDNKTAQLSDLQTAFDNKSKELADLQNAFDSKSKKLADLQSAFDSKSRELADLQNRKKLGVASGIVKVITLPFRLIGKIKKQIRDIKYFVYIKRSGQFNNEWYLGNNPDVAQKFRSSFWHKLDETKIPLLSQFGKFMAHPLMHYIKCGCYEHRKPTAYFDGDEYCLKYSDVDVNVINPFYHYLKFGIAEGRTHSLEQFIKDSRAQLHKLLGIRSYFLQPEDKVKTDFTSKKIAVHLHLYYVDLADEMIAYLKNIPANFDLYISVIDQDCNSIAKRFKDSIPLLNSVKVKNVPNRGRDLAPFLLTFGKELLKYDYCCHIHSKKSLHNDKLKGWRKYLLSNLLGSPEQVAGILNLLIRDGKFVFPKSYIYTSDVTNWGGNFKIACDFFAGKGLSIDKYHIVEFPQGTMFWCRSNCLKRIMQLNLKWTDFPEEPIGADGSLAHVLERSFLILADDIEGFVYSLCNCDSPE